MALETYLPCPLYVKFDPYCYRNTTLQRDANSILRDEEEAGSFHYYSDWGQSLQTTSIPKEVTTLTFHPGSRRNLSVLITINVRSRKYLKA
jgi:hypothetical protein